ncbi:sulfatase family protein [Candidatus Pelagisphaera phototrophica]|uniref:sulfatase family protein n=1 Tax=Candidatus Pelagisphaera phototrophica TaxID=2684113 RepID=UPI0019E83656|nr:sulfatase-like hydrolase/transferase [Candidatus Pelagisphaera phototrophica]QXD30902.1 sulfatase-like hydrolase/transferase [Candidatus Pelagisphaera phototrophica]
MRFLRALIVSLCLASTSLAADRPNILLIFTDDQGINDVGCYGSEIPTPNIDRLASEGLKFEQWYSASSICTPSRFGLLTGQNPSRSKDQLLSALMFMADEHKETGIQQSETTIAEKLRESGYDTALIGKWHLGHGGKDLLPTRHGFNSFIGHTGGCIDFFTMTYGNIPDWYHQEVHVSENGYATELITDEAISYLEDREDEEDPFFLYLAYNAPHFGKGWSPSTRTPINIMQPQAEDLRRVSGIEDKVRREFAAMTVSLDDGVGKVIEALDANGLSEDTLVIFLTDHGGDPVYGGNNLPYRGDKATLFEGGLRVPCIMRWPGKIEAGNASDVVCSSLDLFPTFCSLAGIASDESRLDGRNLSSVMIEGIGWSERMLFWELGVHAELGRNPWSAVRSGDWKYLQTPDDGEFLFNVAKDPYEKRNLMRIEPDRFKDLRALRDNLSSSYRN